MPRRTSRTVDGAAFTHHDDRESSEEWLRAFRIRQEEDLKRRQDDYQPHRRKPFHKRYTDETTDEEGDESANGLGEEAWRNHDGERLEDFGVEEDVEFYDEEDVPLAKLLRHRGTQIR